MIKPRATLNNIEAYAIDENYPSYEIKIDSNENPYGTPDYIKSAIQNFDFSKISIYPAYGELLKKLSEMLDAKPENFILTNGCDEAINVVLRTYLEAGDEVLTFAPTFSMPELYCSVIGAKFEKIPYEAMWKFDYEIFTSKITDKTKILYLTSPNNPTGNIVDKEDIVKLLTAYQDKLLMLDCTYLNYSKENFIEYCNLAKVFKNLVILKSFSKDYALAGLRLGYVFADSEITNALKKVQSPYPVNAIAVEAGLAALNNCENFAKIKENILKSKEILIKGLEKLGYIPFESEANFILCSFGPKAEFLYNKLLTKGIKVKFYKNAGVLTNCFRITIPRLEDVEKVLAQFEPRPLFVFDMDGVLFDVSGSYREAIRKTYEFYAKKECTDSDIQKVKNLGGMSNDWNVTHYMLQQSGVNIEYDKVVETFQELFFNPDKEGSKGLIDNEKIVFDKIFFENLTKIADCAIFTSRPKVEAFYSLEKSGIKKYFSCFITNEDVNGNYKPSPYGLNLIKNKCLYTDIFYFGDTVDDIKSGVDADVKAFGIIPPRATEIEETKKELIKQGAKDVFETPEALFRTLVEKDVVCK